MREHFSIILKSVGFLRGGLRFLPLVLILVLATSSLESIWAQDESETLDERVDYLIDSLSTKQKVGQIFIFGYSGTKLEPALGRTLRRYQPGGIIAFKRNIKDLTQTAKTNYKAQNQSLQLNQLPLLVMVDQEGGSVTRIRTKPLPPSALAIGKTREPKLALETGRVTGKILNLLGFNMNLAPVVDLSNPNVKNFIGNRSFGEYPHEVKAMAEGFSRGLLESGVLPTLKHYPGHGNVIQDSHKGLPKKTVTLTELEKGDLVPFRHFAEANVPSAMMVAHIAFPNIDPSGLPATFSKVMVNNLIRKKLQYKGLLITDDIEMSGADSIKSIGERAVRAFEAGNDMIMVAWSRGRQRRAFKGLLRAVKSGRVSKERLKQSLRRIIRAKLAMSKVAPITKKSPRSIRIELSRHVESLIEVTNKITKANLKRSLQKSSFLIHSVEPTQQILVSTSDYKFYKAFKESIKNKTTLNLLKRKKSDRLAKLLDRYPEALSLYYVTGLGTARRLNRLGPEEKMRTIVITSTHAGAIKDSDQFKAVIGIGSRNYNVGQWIGEMLISNKDERLPASNWMTDPEVAPDEDLESKDSSGFGLGPEVGLADDF